MKTIEVSIDVFARIWLLRAPGESNEDEILKRILDVAPNRTAQFLPRPVVQASAEGFFDSRHNVQFPEGFEIFRTYLGREFRALASSGSWVMSHDNTAHRSLNELSKAIGARTENAWKNWFFLDKEGFRKAVADLRNPAAVSIRSAQAPDEESWEIEDSESHTPNGASVPDLGDGTWRDDVKSALESLGGKSALHNIYRETEKLRRSVGRTVPRTLEAVIRRTLEDHSSDSHNYRGGLDLFCMPEGKGAGIWALRK